MASAIVSIANFMQFAAIFGFAGGDDEEGSNPFAALLLAFVAPIAASLIQFAISRSREYLADDTGAQLSGNPLYLASALEKLNAYSQQVPMQHGGEATAHMFIVNPFSGANMAKLFSTHPPIEERVSRLRNMAHR
jgi:heat shock protein HtpX